MLICLVATAMIPFGPGCKRQSTPSNATRQPTRDGVAAPARERDKPSRETENTRERKKNGKRDKLLADREAQKQADEETKQNRLKASERLTLRYTDALVTESKTAAQASFNKVLPYVGSPKGASLVFTFQDQSAKTLTLVTAQVDKIENGVFHGKVVRVDPKDSDSAIKEKDTVTMTKEEVVDWTLVRADGSAYGQFLMRSHLKQLIDGGKDSDGEAAKRLAKLGEPLPPPETP